MAQEKCHLGTKEASSPWLMHGCLSQIRVIELLRTAEEVGQLRRTCEELRIRSDAIQTREDHTKQLEAGVCWTPNYVDSLPDMVDACGNKKAF